MPLGIEISAVSDINPKAFQIFLQTVSASPRKILRYLHGWNKLDPAADSRSIAAVEEIVIHIVKEQILVISGFSEYLTVYRNSRIYIVLPVPSFNRRNPFLCLHLFHFRRIDEFLLPAA